MINNMQESNKLINTLIDYIFWVLLILFTNPGGMVEALNIYYIIGKVNINDLVFVFLTICYLIIPRTNDILDRDFKLITLCIVLFLIYYFTFHVYLVPQLNGNKSYSLITNLTKSRLTFYDIMLFIYMYEFFKRRIDIFMKVFTISSVIVLLLFLSQLVIKVNILPVYSVNRSFIKY